MLGRPYRHKRTFIIDSSVLPSIPASPTTIVVMANAVRICKAIITI
jgi:choline dehydrogenase-like flavoprotein